MNRVLTALILTLFWPHEGHATKPIPVLELLTPNSKLFVPAGSECRELFLPAIRTAPSIRDVRDARAREYTKRELLQFVSFLLEKRFFVTSATLTVESPFVRDMLAEKFGVALAGKELYQLLSQHFSSIEEAALATSEGRKLAAERDDANYKSWSESVLTKLAKELEALGLPFEREFLKKNSSQVGMTLSKIYGYPVRGDQIIIRTEKLGLTIDQIRRKAGLPKVSPNIARLKAAEEIPWSKDLVTRFLTIVKDSGIPIRQSTMEEKRHELSDLIYKETGYRVAFHDIEDKVYELFGGWPEVKKTLGFTYEGRKRQDDGRPDWSKEFMIEMFQYLNKLKFELTWTNLTQPEKYAPIRAAIKEKYGFEIRGKTIYEYAFDRFGNWEKAMLAAGVPYINKTDAQVPTVFKGWADPVDPERINAPLVIELLKFIDAQGVLIEVPLFENAERFEPLRKAINDEFKLNISGQLLWVKIRAIFGGLGKATEAAQVVIPKEPEVWTPELKQQALAVVYEKYPGATAANISRDYSEEIGVLLKERLKIIASGYTLWKVAKEIIAANNAAALKAVADASKKKFTRAEVIRILQIIKEQGYLPTRDIFFNAKAWRAVSPAIEKEMGFIADQRSVFDSARTYFDNIYEARRAAGLKKREGLIWDEAFTLEALKAALEIYPELSENSLRLDDSKGVAALITKKFGVEAFQNTLLNSIEEHFDNLKAAFEKIGYTRWTRANPPSLEQVVDILIFIDAKGFEITGFVLQNAKAFAPIQKAIDESFPPGITGQKIYFYANKHFGFEGWKKAMKEAGIKTTQKVEWTPDNLKEALKLVVRRFPFLTQTIMKQQSEAIDAIIFENFHTHLKGSSLYEHINERLGGLESALKKIGHKSPWPKNGLPSKEFYIEVLQYIDSKGFRPTAELFINADQYEPVRKLIEERWGLQVSGGAIRLAGRDLFGNFWKARIAAGFTRYEGGALWTPEIAKEALGHVMEKYPNLSASMMSVQKSGEIKALLKEKMKVDIAGATLREYLEDYFGNVEAAQALIGKPVFWPDTGLPPKENIITVFLFIDSLGYDITSALMQNEKAWAPIGKAIEAHFGFPIPRISLYKRAKTLFGGKIENAKLAAGIKDRKIPFLGDIESKEKFAEFLQFLSKRGFLISEELFSNDGSFNDAAAEIEKEYHVRATWSGMYRSGVTLYGSFRNALRDNGFTPKGDIDWSPEFMRDAIAVAYELYPDLNYQELLRGVRAKRIERAFKRRFFTETSTATLIRKVRLKYGSFRDGVMALGFATPWMIDNLKAPETTKPQLVKVVRKLKTLGIVARHKTLHDYSQQIGYLLVRDFKLPMTGVTLDSRLFQQFTKEHNAEALKLAGVARDDIYTDRAFESAFSEGLVEMLDFVNRFGFSLSDQSMTENSNSIAWVVFLKFGRLANGIDLLKAANEQGVRRRQTGAESATLALNETSLPMVMEVLSAAGLQFRNAEEITAQTVQIQRIVTYHFGKKVDLNEFAAKILN